MNIDTSLIIKDLKEENKREIVIKRLNPNVKERETKLSDVLQELPCGLILKEETGIGATTLELKSKRNSIIVEPIKITASSKAKEHDGLYVGSPTRHHPNKLSNPAILEYISNDTISYKKIVVVADSLNRLLSVMTEAVYKDYFLLIDEIDSFQLDSFYRSSMEECVDTYKSFPAAKRAMVSATIMAFSDPELSKEPLTHIKYDKPSVRRIDLNYAPQNIKSAGIDKIQQLLKNYPQDKILIAYNSVSGCKELKN